MTISKIFRPAFAAAVVASLAFGAIASPAIAANSRRGNEEVGAAVALGIGAVVIGSILANKSRRDRHREEYREPPRPHYQQHRYSHPAPHVNRAPAYLNDGH